MKKKSVGAQYILLLTMSFFTQSILRFARAHLRKADCGSVATATAMVDILPPFIFSFLYFKESRVHEYYVICFLDDADRRPPRRGPGQGMHLYYQSLFLLVSWATDVDMPAPRLNATSRCL